MRAHSQRLGRAGTGVATWRVALIGLVAVVPALGATTAAPTSAHRHVRPVMVTLPAVSYVRAVDAASSIRTRAVNSRSAPVFAGAIRLDAGYIYPLAVRGTITACPFVPGSTHSPFAWPNNLESDDAIDINIPLGTPVLAVAAGVIGSQIGLQHSPDPHMAGLRVHLDTPTRRFYYAHLSRLFVHAGQAVAAGQVLGLSGQAVGVPHLEFAQDGGNPAVTVGDATACPYFVQYKEPW